MKRAARRLASSLYAAGARHFTSGASDSAAGIAYRVLFSLAPLIVALVSVFGLLLQNRELKMDVINKIVSVLPVKGESVTKAIENIATPASVGGLVSLLVLVWAASGMMSAIRSALQRAMNSEEGENGAEVNMLEGVARGKLVDLALVCATVLLVLASAGVAMVTQLVNSLVAEVAGALDLKGSVAKTVVSKLLPLLLWTGTVLLLYRRVPARRPRFVDALAGAVVTALLLLVISLAAGFLYAHATKWSFIYGSLTSVFVFLYSVYLFASAVLFGAAFTMEWPQHRKPA